jgi:hypothetical protein
MEYTITPLTRVLEIRVALKQIGEMEVVLKPHRDSCVDLACQPSTPIMGEACSGQQNGVHFIGSHALR